MHLTFLQNSTHCKISHRQTRNRSFVFVKHFTPTQFCPLCPLQATCTSSMIPHQFLFCQGSMTPGRHVTSQKQRAERPIQTEHQRSTSRRFIRNMLYLGYGSGDGRRGPCAVADANPNVVISTATDRGGFREKSRVGTPRAEAARMTAAAAARHQRSAAPKASAMAIQHRAAPLRLRAHIRFTRRLPSRRRRHQ